MNDIIVVPKEIDDVVVYEGIEFRDCTFIDIYDDAGWDYINVEHDGSKVVWCFDRDQDSRFEFSKAEYIKQVASCESLLNLSRYPLAMPISGQPMY